MKNPKYKIGDVCIFWEKVEELWYQVIIRGASLAPEECIWEYYCEGRKTSDREFTNTLSEDKLIQIK